MRETRTCNKQNYYLLSFLIRDCMDTRDIRVNFELAIQRHQQDDQRHQQDC